MTKKPRKGDLRELNPTTSSPGLKALGTRLKILNNFTGVHAPGPFLEAYEFDGREENRQYLS